MDRQRFQKTQQIFFMQAKAPRRGGAIAMAMLQRKRTDLRIQEHNAELPDLRVGSIGQPRGVRRLVALAHSRRLNDLGVALGAKGVTQSL
jgi:hypothetical protein